jgi:ABC-type Fe3+-hydroxamate transport system substrate-binding protein
MSIELQALQEQLQDALNRIARLEQRLGEREAPRWRYLMSRPHPWRKQLYIKGRNMTVGQLMSTVGANRLTPQGAAIDLDLPVEAILEAQAYYEENKGLIQMEAAEERRFLAEQGLALEPQHLSR